jgi:hypothetical protein
VKNLYLGPQTRINGLDSLRALEQLILIKTGKQFFTRHLFASWSELRSLTLLSPKLPPDLSFLNNSHKLRELEIYNCRSEFDCTEIASSLNSLEELRIERCKNIKGLEVILPQLKSLITLAVIDSIALKSATFVGRLPNLKNLIVMGSSFFENGDLSNLKGRLEHLGIDNKKHYNLKFEDFKN